MRKYKIVKKIRRVPGKGENIMNKNARKLIPAVAMLLVSATMLSTASFAWFSMNSQVEATGMQVNVDAPTSLLISRTSATAGFANSIDFGEDSESAQTLGHASSTNGESIFAISSGMIDENGDIEASNNLTDVTASDNYGDVYGVADTVGFVDYEMWIATTGTDNVQIALTTGTGFSTTGTGVADLLPALRFAVLTGVDGSEKVPTEAENGNVWAGDTTNSLDEGSQAYESITYGDLGDVNHYTTGAALVNISGTAEEATVNGTRVVIRVWLEGEDDACINANAVNLGQYQLRLVFSLVGG